MIPGPTKIIDTPLAAPPALDRKFRLVAAILLSILCGPLRAACVPSFQAQEFFGTLPYASTITTANLNGDAWIDVVVGNDDGNRPPAGLSVLLGQTGGSFTSARTFSTEHLFMSIAAADFDGDGDDDIVAYASGKGAAYLFRNDASNMVEVGRFVHASANGRVVAGDFNGDGHSDFVILSQRDSSTVAVQFGAGDGTTFRSLPVLTDGAVLDITGAVADFDSDGFDDLAITRSTDATILVLFGTADGFRPPASYRFTPPRGQAYAVEVADVDRDGAADLFVLFASGFYGIITNVSASARNAPAVIAGKVVGSDPVEIGDLNRDGYTDIVTLGHGGIIVSLGTGQGFAPAEVYMTLGPGGSNPQDIEVADFDRDGDADVVAATPHAVALLRNDGTGAFRSPRYAGAANAITDLTGDGVADLLIGAHVGRGLTNGQFETSLQSPFVGSPPAVGDLNADGLTDFVTLQVATRTIGINKGDGSFALTTAKLTGEQYEGRAQLADINGDGKLDLLTTSGQLPGGVYLSRGNGDGTFADRARIADVRNAGGVRLGEFNGDGRTDLLVLEVNSNISFILLNDGLGGFVKRIELPPLTDANVTVGDLNGDRVDDIVSIFSVYLTIIRIRPDGTFAVSTSVYESGDFHGEHVVISDLNRDGFADLLAVESRGEGHGVALMALGDGKGAFAAPVPLLTTGAGDVFVYDFNADGRLDLLDGGYVRLQLPCAAPRRRSSNR